MGSDGVEVAQQHRGEAGVGGAVVPQDLLDHHLGPAVGVGGGGFHVFGVGALVFGSVDRGRGGEDDLFAAVPLHGLQKGQGGVQIVAIVAQGDPDALAHRLKPGKVDHRVDLVFREGLLQRFAVGHVDGVDLGHFTGDPGNPLRHVPAGVEKVVGDDHVIARVQKFHTGVGADVSGSSGD